MATALSSISPPPNNTFSPTKSHKPPPSLWALKPFHRPLVPSIQLNSPFSAKSPPCSFNGDTGSTVADGQQSDDVSISIDVLRRFIDLNLGNWIGSFHVIVNSIWIFNLVWELLCAFTWINLVHFSNGLLAFKDVRKDFWLISCSNLIVMGNCCIRLVQNLLQARMGKVNSWVWSKRKFCDSGKLHEWSFKHVMMWSFTIDTVCVLPCAIFASFVRIWVVWRLLFLIWFGKFLIHPKRKLGYNLFSFFPFSPWKVGMLNTLHSPQFVLVEIVSEI